MRWFAAIVATGALAAGSIIQWGPGGGLLMLGGLTLAGLLIDVED